MKQIRPRQILKLVWVPFALTVLSSPQAQASGCTFDEYDHNGSDMEVQICDTGSLRINYSRPRQGMRKHGVRSGTLLFDGTVHRGRVNGQARLFNRNCGEITYNVSGSIARGAIVLRGSAPVRNRNCRVTRHRRDTLKFTLQGAGSGPVAGGGGQQGAPTPTCPRGYVFSQRLGQCERDRAPAPAPRPTAGDWYAIAASSRTFNPAQDRVNQLGGNWFVMKSFNCPNFTAGYFVATVGPVSKRRAQNLARSARRFGAYAKKCN